MGDRPPPPPRPILPRAILDPQDGQYPPALSSPVGQTPSALSSNPRKSSPKKRVIVALACTRCRKRKTKCDGKRPNCSSCLTSNSECTYTPPDGVVAREERDRKTQSLIHAHSTFQHFINRFREGSDSEVAELIQIMKGCATVEDVVEVVDGASYLAGVPGEASSSTTQPREKSETLPSIAGSPALMAAVTPSSVLMPSSRRDAVCQCCHRRSSPPNPTDEPGPSSHYMTKEGVFDIARIEISDATRTIAATEPERLRHFLLLLLSWDEGINCFVDWEMLLKEMRILQPHQLITATAGTAGTAVAANLGDDMLCSPALINALLAWGCLHSTRDRLLIAFGDPSSRARRFAQEALHLLGSDPSDAPFAKMQALSLLSEYESLFGDPYHSLDLLNKSYDLYDQLAFNDATRFKQKQTIDIDRDEYIQPAQSVILWGLYVRDSKLSMLFGHRMKTRKPSIPKYFENAATSLVSNPDSASYWWFPYPTCLHCQRSFRHEVLIAEVSLAELTERVLQETVTSDKYSGSFTYMRSINAPRTLGLYDELMKWRSSLPEGLQLSESSLPSILLLHLTFDCLVIQLLRPLYRIPNQQMHAKTTCHTYAAHIMSVLWTYRSLYTLHHERLAVQGCLTAAFATILDLEPGSIEMDTFSKACRGLKELSETWPHAGYILKGISAFANKFSSRIPEVARTFLYDSIWDDPKVGLTTASGGFDNARIPLVLPLDMPDDSYGYVQGDSFYLTFTELIGSC